MINLSETDLQLKGDLDKIISGGYDQYLSPEQVEMALELSFLFNYTNFVNVGAIEFNYQGFKVRISGLDDLFFGGFSTDEAKDTIIYQIKNEQNFKSALLSYKRNYKINKIV